MSWPRGTSVLLAAPLAVLLLVAGRPALGIQEGQGAGEEATEQQQDAPPQEQPQQAPADDLSPEEAEALELVEEILEEEEGVLTGREISYDPARRRDPFRSLLQVAAATQAPSVRPPGLPGFLISEVEVTAVAQFQGRWHAMLVGPDRRAYFAEVGTDLFDGHVIEISEGEVLFEQEVQDLLGARSTRQVVKRLTNTEGTTG